MSAEVETMAYAISQGLPWHTLGNPVNDDMTTDEMLVASGLDWGVIQRPLYFQKEEGGTAMKRAHDRFALLRDSDLKMLDVTTERWTPTQNAEVFEFFRKYVEAGDMKMDTAGSLRGGQIVWCLARMSHSFKIGKGDLFNNYLLLMAPHRVGYALIAKYTAVRVVCKNTMMAALGGGFDLKGKRESGTFRMSHVRKFDEAARTEASEVLGLAHKRMAEFQEAVAFLATKTAKPDEIKTFWYEVLDDEVPEDDEDAPRLIKKLNQALLTAPGADFDTAKGTWFGALNAVTFVVDHDMGRTRDTAMASAWMGQGANMKKRAFEAAVAHAKAA